jgi:hypothetical protein
LKNINENTFVRFSEYIYTENYITANPNIIFYSIKLGNRKSITDNSAFKKVNLDDVPLISNYENPISINSSINAEEIPDDYK